MHGARAEGTGGRGGDEDDGGGAAEDPLNG